MMKVVVMVEMKAVVKVVMKVILAEKILILASNTSLQKSIKPILTTIFICATLITIPSPPSSQPP